MSDSGAANGSRWPGTIGPAVPFDMTVTAPPPLPPHLLGPSHGLVYDGSLRELYQIFFRNLLLIIATCGVYYFWGKVRLRQYLWSRLSFDGHRLEFRGKGGEMFKGFVMVLAGLTVWGIATTALELSVGVNVIWVAPLVSVLTVILIFYLAFVAQFSAQRYRLTRTRWRGIGGGMEGSSLRYGVKAMLLMLLLSISLAQTRPYVSLRLLEYRVNRVFLGDRRLQISNCKAGDLYGSYLLRCLAVGGVMFVFLIVLGATVGRSIYSQGDVSGRSWLALAAIAIGTYALAYMLVAWVMAGFWSRFWNYAGDRITWGAAKLEVKSTGRMFVQHRVVNMLALLFSAGLAYPWALQRMTRYLTESIALRGELALDELRQTDLTGAAIGEGLLNAFDPGFI